MSTAVVDTSSSSTNDAAHTAITTALEAGLRAAGSSNGLTFIALPAPVVASTAIVHEFREQPLVAWTSPELTLVGVGVAAEVRGEGTARWSQVITGARSLVAVGAQAVIDGEVASVDTLGIARPRFVGGAAFAPGAASKAPWTGFGDAWFVLPRWTYVHDGARAFVVLAVDARAAGDAQQWREELAILRRAFAVQSYVKPPLAPGLSSHAIAISAQPALVEIAPAPADEWRTQVTDITDVIAKGTCSKIVAARTCTVQLSAPVKLAELLGTLDERHADCVRVIIKPPGAGALIAATPERLVRRDGDVVLADALAGSISPNGDAVAAERTLRASTKDRREHDIVVDAIRTALADTGEVTAPSQPEVKRTRHVMHLHTPFTARLRAPYHVLELAARLHPTPAVGGTPSAFAAEWIAEHEPVARGWYSAPVGWFDLDGNGELAVALRSGVIAGTRAHLWAGAGIVAGSDPDRELAETEIKFRTVLGALGVQA